MADGGILLVSARAAAQRPETSETAVKAAFLYNFTKFVEWPDAAFAQPSTPFVVCAFADAAFRKEAERDSRQRAGSRPPDRASRRRPLDDPRAATSPISRAAEVERQARMLAAVKQIAGADGGRGPALSQQGGLIAFMLENDRVRFAISKRAADAAGLNVSSKLLRVAGLRRGTQP